MTSLAMFATSMPDDLDSQLEKLSLKLVQNSMYKKSRYNPQIQNHTFIYNSKSSSLYSIPDKLTIEAKKSEKKKAVRFADSLGFELVTVKIMSNSFINDKTVHSEESEESEDITSEEEESKVEPDPNSFVYDNLNFRWQCLFEQPGLQPDFYARLNQTKVMIETVYTNQFKLNGFIRVSNLSFHKRVFIRYTLNKWNTYTDYECTYLLNGSNEKTDRFKFAIILDKPGLLNIIDQNLRLNRDSNSPVLKLEFAVCYETKCSDNPNEISHCSYWDNNNSINYQYNCFFNKIVNPLKQQ